MKHVLTVLTVVLALVAGQVYAMQAPQDLVKEASEQMLSKLKDEHELLQKEPNRIYDLVNQIVLPHFDFEYMSQMVLAKHWRRASPEERQAFTEEFKMLLVRTYATSLNEYTDQELIYLPFRPERDESKATVQTEVEQPGGFPIPIDYRLHKISDVWKVFDVVIDGVSLVTNYRTSFAREIREGGLGGLIKSLAQRNAEAQK